MKFRKFILGQSGEYFLEDYRSQLVFVSQYSDGHHKNKTHNNLRAKDEFEYYN